jgi:uncharacterized cupin superfamily protein
VWFDTAGRVKARIVAAKGFKSFPINIYHFSPALWATVKIANFISWHSVSEEIIAKLSKEKSTL